MNHCRAAPSGDAGAIPVVCGADWLPAFAAGGIRSFCCNAIVIPAPQATPTNHETMMAFVNLHHIVASTVMVCRRYSTRQSKTKI
jgi:hypothetical protein